MRKYSPRCCSKLALSLFFVSMIYNKSTCLSVIIKDSHCKFTANLEKKRIFAKELE